MCKYYAMIIARGWKEAKSSIGKLQIGVALVSCVIGSLIFFVSKGLDAMMIEGLNFVAFTLTPIIALTLMYLVYHIVSAPAVIYNEQLTLITQLQKDENINEIISRLYDQRKKGVELRNRGMRLMDYDQIDPWWEEFDLWREETENIISLLDPNRAKNFHTLGGYQATIKFGNALTTIHYDRVQMFSSWIGKLGDEIKYWEVMHNSKA